MKPPVSSFRPLSRERARAILRDARPCPHCGNLTPPKTLAARQGVNISTVRSLVNGHHRHSALDPDGTDDGPDLAARLPFRRSCVPSERVAELRRAVTSGAYEIPPPDALAEAVMLNSRIIVAAA
jgi:hypothetical protein